MNIFKEIKADIVRQLELLVKEGKLSGDFDYEPITAELPRESSHGDVAINAAMVLAKAANKNPRALAEIIVEKLKNNPDITEASIAGPGFINLRLTNAVWQKVLLSVLKDGTSYGNSDMGKGEKINLEYVSANPTGPMHIGHSRNAIYGDVLALLLLKSGHNVTKEYYINDAGAQIEVLAKSAFLRYKEALGMDIGEIPEGLYPGEYLKPVGLGLKEKHEKDLLSMPEPEALAIVKDFVIDSMLLLIKSDLLDLGVQHDVFVSEKDIQKKYLDKIIDLLKDKDLVYRGILEPPKGKAPDDWEPREQLLFRSSNYGDDTDRPLQKSDGTWTYFASDIAYHYDKLQRGFKKMILVVASDHGGYAKRMKAAVAALSNKSATINVQLYQLVNLLEDGEPVKMSKRKGNFLTVADVVKDVGKDIIRFVMLTKKHDTVLDFDLKKVKEQSKDNPVFYVQYAHARAFSIFRNAPEAAKNFDKVDLEILSELNDPAELELIKKIAQWPRIVESSAHFLEPHRVAYYLYELASYFHALWNKGKDNPGLRFILEDNDSLTKARLALVKSCSITIASGLNVLGVEPVTEM